MDITVTSDFDSERGLVEFASPVGRAHGKWKGDEIPRRGVQYRVEVEIPDGASVGREPLVPTGFLADDEQGGTIISGTVESVAEDGVVVLRIGPDIVLLELVEPALMPQPAQVMSLNVPEIALYPYEL